MGMHFGVIAAKTSWTALLAALAESFGEFSDRGSVEPTAEAPFERGEDGILAGELDGCSFVLDSSMLLSASEYDKLRDVSVRIDSLLVACVAETVSGSFGLFVADRGKVVRLYWNCTSALFQALQIGNQLPCESEVPVEEIDGAGLFAAMRQFGLDFEKWYRQGTRQAYVWKFNDAETENDLSPGGKGPLSLAIAEHEKQFSIPTNKRSQPTVVSRRMSDGSTGYDIVSSPSSVAKNKSQRSFLSKIWLRVLGR